MNNTFKKYQKYIAKFAPTAEGPSTDDTKIHYAAIHLAVLAGLITSDFIKANPSIKDNDQLRYTFACILLEDDRVRTNLALTTSAWEELADLPYFESTETFNNYYRIISDKDGLDEDISSCCF
jgi:hypothetical protein